MTELKADGSFSYVPDPKYWNNTPAVGAPGLTDHFTYYVTNQKDGRRSTVTTVEIVQGQAVAPNNAADKEVKSLGGYALGGGGTNDLEAAYQWLIGQANGGDIVVLSASGTAQDDINLFDRVIQKLPGGIKKPNSVRAFVVTTPDQAADTNLIKAVSKAEAIFIDGGDQTRYYDMWAGSTLQDALRDAVGCGVTIGGTSAGCALLGGVVFTGPAAGPNLESPEALKNPYATAFVGNQTVKRVDLKGSFVSVAGLAGVVTDTHFGDSREPHPQGRNRMGRLVTFLARMKTDAKVPPDNKPAPYYQEGNAKGVGVDEGTFLLVKANGDTWVVGEGNVYFVTAADPPATCLAGEPLIARNLLVRRVDAKSATAAKTFRLSTAWDTRIGVFGLEYHIRTADNRTGTDLSGLTAVDRAGGNEGVY